MALLFFSFLSFPGFARQSEIMDTENSSASLEMIAERMKALSGSLAAMPGPPQLNQVIQIPEGFGPSENFEKPETQKETKK